MIRSIFDAKVLKVSIKDSNNNKFAIKFIMKKIENADFKHFS